MYRFIMRCIAIAIGCKKRPPAPASRPIIPRTTNIVDNQKDVELIRYINRLRVEQETKQKAEKKSQYAEWIKNCQESAKYSVVYGR